jgi:hypothetical protein
VGHAWHGSTVQPSSDAFRHTTVSADLSLFQPTYHYIPPCPAASWSVLSNWVDGKEGKSVPQHESAVSQPAPFCSALELPLLKQDSDFSPCKICSICSIQSPVTIEFNTC